MALARSETRWMACGDAAGEEKGDEAADDGAEESGDPESVERCAGWRVRSWSISSLV